ncbi:SgcJ/EcaC family oxidoreductase [Luteimonas sp. RD2P54]|uniref:SgcJ/EcaC family oxidoreductase n=1 Tax=Luteimonas endophytica TaxID=3042023 RepID=A0ABT6J7B9_9GAMM|nr:SgcJ/EcaC family oxidoreductase [Luteimonas endophytica]MDH5822073.1 SgcJ/EcaC family oxidoreductase [Luteimonas endophytica]
MNDEKEIRNLVDTWMTATKAGDSETVLGLMTDDVVFLVAGQEPFGKSAFAEASEAQSNASVEFDGESEVIEVKVQGDWAYAVTKLRVTATQLGKEPMVRSGHTLTILQKDAGKWKIARDANLLVPVSASEGDA